MFPPGTPRDLRARLHALRTDGGTGIGAPPRHASTALHGAMPPATPDCQDGSSAETMTSAAAPCPRAAPGKTGTTTHRESIRER